MDIVHVKECQWYYKIAWYLLLIYKPDKLLTYNDTAC